MTDRLVPPSPTVEISRPSDPAQLLEAARAGERRALARLLSLVEAGGWRGRAVATLAYRSGAEPRTVGITGAPGAGKSTLTGRLLGAVRASGAEQVAVLAIDPTSPYSGGAMLGDRVRMQDYATDRGVYIRSMATRGHLGGLSVAVPEAIRLLGAAGMPLVLVETVGVGQVEVEVASATDTTVVVVNPRWGDAIQANKAGLMEIADVFVINKADMPGAAETRRDLQQMLDLAGHTPAGHGSSGGAGSSGSSPVAHSPDGDTGGIAAASEERWRPPIVETVAATGQGLDELWEAVVAHQQFLDTSGGLKQRRQRRLRDELGRILDARIAAEVAVIASTEHSDVLQAVLEHRLDPYAAADRLVSEAVRAGGRDRSRSDEGRGGAAGPGEPLGCGDAGS